jgi:hypothetical protein
MSVAGTIQSLQSGGFTEFERLHRVREPSPKCRGFTEFERLHRYVEASPTCGNLRECRGLTELQGFTDAMSQALTKMYS